MIGGRIVGAVRGAPIPAFPRLRRRKEPDTASPVHRAGEDTAFDANAYARVGREEMRRRPPPQPSPGIAGGGSDRLLPPARLGEGGDGGRPRP